MADPHPPVRLDLVLKNTAWDRNRSFPCRFFLQGARCVILDFTLTDAEMAEIARLDKNEWYYHRTDAQLVQFSTHEGSGLSGFDRKLASACPDAQVPEGFAVRGNDCQNRQDSVRNTVQTHLSSLGF